MSGKTGIFKSMSAAHSYWETQSFFNHFDVLVIGSGIVGLSSAIFLKEQQPALKVGILEAGFLPSGASTKNAGFACFGSISELLDELEAHSEDELLTSIERKWKGLGILKKSLGERAIDYVHGCGYELFPYPDRTLAECCSDHISHFNKLLKPIIGHADIYADASENMAGFGLSGACALIRNKEEGSIHTGKMMQAMLSKAASLGVLIFNNCRVNAFDRQGMGISVVSREGRFSTKKVILATNAFASEFYPELDILPGRGQVLVTGPIPGLKLSGTFHYDRGYYYFRNIDNRVLIGGGRNLDFKAEETTETGITGPVQQSIEELLYTHIVPGQRPEIAQRWSGVMAFGKDLEPIIRKLEENIYCALRCNGMGVAQGSLTGREAAELVLADI